jgi:hypothetical protein
VKLEGLGELKSPKTTLGIEHAAFMENKKKKVFLEELIFFLLVRHRQHR